MKRKTKYTDKELAEAHVFPSQLSASEKKKSEEEVTDFRSAQIKDMSQKNRNYSQALKLKYSTD